MKYFMISSKKNAYAFFIIPFLLFIPLAFYDEYPYPVFNRLIATIVFVGLFLGHALFQYMLTNHMKPEQKPSIYVYYAPSFLILFLYYIVFAIQHPNIGGGLNVYDDSAIERTSESKNNDTQAGFEISEDLNMEHHISNASEVLDIKKNEFYLPNDENFSLPKQFTSFVKETARNITKTDEANAQYTEIAQEFGVKFGDFFNSSDWEGIRELVDEYSIILPDAPSIAANLLLLFGAPISELESYLALGAEVALPSTLNLASSGRIKDLKQLENYGVSYSSELPLQMSILDLALMNVLSKDGFNFLIERVDNLSVFKPDLQVDTLGIALLNAELNSTNAPYFIRAILETDGVEFNKQHEAILSQLQQSSPTLANRIIAILDSV